MNEEYGAGRFNLEEDREFSQFDEVRDPVS